MEQLKIYLQNVGNDVEKFLWPNVEALNRFKIIDKMSYIYIYE